jgi:fructose-1,6-bisphosphatase/inositol monophosphatase family enzyme
MVKFTTIIEHAVEAAMSAVFDFDLGGKVLRSSTKSDGSFVTELDMRATEILEEALHGYLPIVSEERAKSHRLIDDLRDCLVIDPIDGTTPLKRYIRGVPSCSGFGPMVGVVFEGRLVATVFGDIYSKSVVTAEQGRGVRVRKLGSRATHKVPKVRPVSLDHAAMIMNVASAREALLAYQLRDEGVVEAVFRYGAISNDCWRIAQGLEEVLLQLRLKPWDFAAVLIAAECGAEVLVDPLGKGVALVEWQVCSNNPVLIANTRDNMGLLKSIRRLLKTKPRL